MKKGIFALVTTLFLVGCRDEQVFDFEVEKDVASLTRSAGGVFGGYFAKVTDPAVWRTFQSLEEMQAACQIPAEELKNLSTEELLQICLEYPLAGNYLAYNNELQGINAVMDGFNGFEELCKRDDGIDKLLDYYEQIEVGSFLNIQNRTGIKREFPNLNLGYVELVLASGRLKDADTPANISRLRGANNRMLSIKKANPLFFGSNSIGRCAIINYQTDSNFKVNPSDCGSSFMARAASGDKAFSSYVTTEIYTKCGKPVEVLTIQEMSSSEMEQIDNYYTQTYPNAVMLARSSNQYNCHSYAWNMSDGGPKCWINATKNDGSENLSTYWRNDYYELWSGETILIHYFNSDHSARISSVAGMCESKWGRAPLMRHSMGYGPYNDMVNYNEYSCRYVRTGLLTTDYGVGETRPEIKSTYTATVPLKDIATGAYVREYWQVYDAKGDDAIGIKAVVEENGNSAQIEFNQIGMYDIYYIMDIPDGNRFVEYYFQALVTQ